AVVLHHRRSAGPRGSGSRDAGAPRGSRAGGGTVDARVPVMNRTSTANRARGTAVAVTSGKGGVGKTSLTVNLAAALAAFGHRVGILDGDFGLGNVDVMLGL